MLDDLNTINWQDYNQAYGSAENIPGLIRDLTRIPTDENDTTVERAIYDLFGMIWHQGTVYSVTSIAVPFLIDIVREDATIAKADVLELLACCGNGNGYAEVHYTIHDNQLGWDATELREAIFSELRDIYRAHEAVNAGLPVYIDALNDPHSRVRRAAAEVLSICTIEGEIAARALIQRIDIEKTLPEDENLTAYLIQHLGHLLTQTQLRAPILNLSAEDDTRFQTWLTDDDHLPDTAKAVAATVLLKHGTADAQQTALDFLFSLPDRTPVLSNIHSWLYDITDVLREYDAMLSLEWLRQMMRYKDSKLLQQLPRYIAGVYRDYRVDPVPVMELLRDLLHHDDITVRERAASEFHLFGYYAQPYISDLEAVLSDTDDSRTEKKLRNLLEKLRQTPPDVASVDRQTLENSLECKAENDLSLNEILNRLETVRDKPKTRLDKSINSLVCAVADYGKAAQQDTRTVPVLQAFTHYPDGWVRVRAAWTLALLAPHETQAITVPVLIEKLQGRPVGLLAMGTLQHLAQQGVDVTDALPRLHEIINSNRRIMMFSLRLNIPAGDDQFQRIAQQTVDMIQAHTGTSDTD